MMASRSSGFTVRQTKLKSEKIEKIKWKDLYIDVDENGKSKK